MSEQHNQRAVPVSPAIHTSSQSGNEWEAGKVVLLGGVAAGLLSGLWVLLSERESKQEPLSSLEQARLAIEDAAAKAKTEGRKAGAELSTNLQGFREDASRKGKRGRKDARKKTSRAGKRAEKEANARREHIAALVSAAREDAKGNLGNLQKNAPDVADLVKQFRARADEASADVKKQGKHLKARAGKDAEKTRKDVNSFVDILKSRAAEAEKVAESYIESNLLPKLKDFEKDAAGMIEIGRGKTEKIRHQAEEELLPQAKERAGKLRKHAEEDVLPQARQRAEKLRKQAEEEVLPQAKANAGKLKATLEEQAADVAGNWDKNSAEAAKKLNEAKEIARAQAQEAGESVKRGGRETRSLLVWTGLAGALVYSVLLNDEQQKKVRQIGMEIFGEARELYGDLTSDGKSLSA